MHLLSLDAFWSLSSSPSGYTLSPAESADSRLSLTARTTAINTCISTMGLTSSHLAWPDIRLELGFRNRDCLRYLCPILPVRAVYHCRTASERVLHTAVQYAIYVAVCNVSVALSCSPKQLTSPRSTCSTAPTCFGSCDDCLGGWGTGKEKSAC